MSQPLLTDQSESPRHRFAGIVAGDDERINLAEAALLIAAEEYTHLDTNLYLEKLDRFSDQARERADLAETTHDLVSALNSTLFEELGFHGNNDNYYDPRNSFLNDVIDRRTGIPITLSVVYMEVARRIGLSIKGVGFPGHFLAKYTAGGREIFVDPFNGGRLLGEAGCSELISNLSQGRKQLRPEHLAEVSNKQILTRMLSNLLSIYAGGRDYRRALAAIDRILLINPHSALHTRDRGLLLAALGEQGKAIADLELYLQLSPAAADASSIREQIKTIRKEMARLN
ncbi:MAG TPA: transglutaminase-like domain-containing protein [Blastocatellia bacterium]|nr:transglutaminase-like domain-containing protein [Blastocatellia bacterium]